MGVHCLGKNENNEATELWKQFLPREREIEQPRPNCAFGLCRCIPGATDGSFEYIAAFAVTGKAPLPAGMMAVDIPRGEYAVFPVADLSEVKQVWHTAAATVNASTEWEPYCGPAGCDCAQHPCFEYYPPEFRGSGLLFVYIPVKRKAGA
jgi:predicted transcriptional regulator YdeE